MRVSLCLILLTIGRLNCIGQNININFLLDGEWETKYVFTLAQRRIYNEKEVKDIFCEPQSLVRAANETRPNFAPATIMRFDAIKKEGIGFSNFFENTDGEIVLSVKPVDLYSFTWRVSSCVSTDSLFICVRKRDKKYVYNLLYLDENILVTIDAEELLVVSLRRGYKGKNISCQDIAMILNKPLKERYFK
jgi:hypothetical protein